MRIDVKAVTNEGRVERIAEVAVLSCGVPWECVRVGNVGIGVLDDPEELEPEEMAERLVEVRW